MITEKIISTNEDYLSKAFKNAGFDKIPDNELIGIVQKEIMSNTPSEQILAVIKKNASESNYEIAQKIIEINNLIGFGRVCKLKTSKGVDKLLEEAKRQVLSQQKMISKELINDLSIEFAPDLNRPIPKKDLQKKLQAIYFKYGILKPDGTLFVVAHDTITQYFYISENLDSTKKNTYTLSSLKHEYLEKINLETEK
jgi:hypothetical protein